MRSTIFAFLVITLFMACQIGQHKSAQSLPLLVNEETFVLINPVGYQLGELTCFDIKEAQEIVFISTKEGELVKKLAYEEPSDFLTESDARAISDSLSVLENARGIRLLSITPGWFSTMQNQVVFSGYLNYEYTKGTDTTEWFPGVANLLSLFDFNVKPTQATLLFATSHYIEDRHNSFPYYPNSYVHGSILQNTLYLSNYQLNPLPLLDKACAFSRWSLQENKPKALEQLGKLRHFLPLKDLNLLSPSEDFGQFWGKAFSLPIEAKPQTLLITESSQGEIAETGESLALDSTLLLLHIHAKQKKFFWQRPNGKDLLFVVSDDLKGTNLQQITPPKGYQIQQLLYTNNDSNGNPWYLLSKDQKFYLWEYQP